MRTTISRPTKLELLAAGRELIKRGYKQIGEPKCLTKEYKNYKYHDSRIGNKNRYSGFNQNMKWIAVYEKE